MPSRRGSELLCLLATALLLVACGMPGTAVPAPLIESPTPDRSEGASQPPRGPPEPPRFERLSVEQGLSQSTVNCILQDSIGFMWFGTEDGLNRYDGYTFTVYEHDPGDANSPSNDVILSLLEDRSGTLWVGTRGGLDALDLATGRWSRYPNDPGAADGASRNWIVSVLEDGAGRLWVGTYGRGLYQFDRQTERFFPLARDLDPWITALSLDRAGDLWVGTEGGLFKVNPDTDQLARYQHDPGDPDSLSSDRITSIHEDRSGALWVGTILGGLERFDRDRSTFAHYPNDPQDPGSLGHHVVASIYEDRSGVLWIGTGGGGLDRLNRASGQFIHARNDPGDSRSLSGNTVMSIYQDRSGALWIGTMGGGISRVDPLTDPWTHYRSDPGDPNSLSNNVVRAIWEDREGVLWIGTDGALDRFDRRTGQWRHYREDPDDPYSLGRSASVRAIVQDREGVLWIGTYGGGLSRYDRETERFTRLLENVTVEWIVEDRVGTLWLGTHGDGLFEFDPEDGVRAQYTRANGLSSEIVRCILEDRSVALWVATDDGLDVLDADRAQWRHHRHDPDDPRSLSPGWVLSIHQDRAGVIWVGTMGGGLNRYDAASGTFVHYRASEGLTNDDVYGILEDGQGRLWLSTNNGLSRFDPRTGAFENERTRGVFPINKYMPDAYHQSGSGEMFFGGVNGLIAFYPADIQGNPYVPPIAFTSLAQNGRSIGGVGAAKALQEITLRWPDNAFEFEFAALSYVQPERNRYAYTLEGYDRQWIDAGANRFGRYTNLPGGTYTLRAKGSNNDGVWNEEGTSLRVTVRPPFWQTWWFRGTVLLALAIGAAGGYRLRMRSVEARSRRLERLVQERTSQLEALYRAEEDMHRHLRLDQVLQSLVDVAVDLLGADKSAVLSWDEGRERWAMRVARGFSPEAMAQLSFARAEGALGQAAESGEPVYVEDAVSTPLREYERPEAVSVALGEGIRSFMHLPIQIDGQTFGVFNVSFARPHAFGPNERRLFLALVQRAALAIENARLYEQAQELAALEERQRLARDLHDAVTQTLFSTSLIAEAAPQVWEQDRDDGRRLLEQVRQGTRSALAEMRTLLLELRPTGLIDANLGDLLRQLGEAAASRSGVSIRVDAESEIELPPEVHVTFYRIAQEALNNVAKHARAGHAWVRLFSSPSITLSIRDDGAGFDPHDVPPDHLGLGIMRERAEAVGATLTVESEPGQGTAVIVEWSRDARPRAKDE